jgi:eukaryotic-like serine/threonine-protein kinase
MPQPPRLEIGDVIGGKYRLESRLARGGMGSVWTARHLELGIQLAIKFMDAPSPQAQVRFAREAKAAAGLRHPNIVDVSDYGVDDGRPYLVMELLRGEDLGVRLKQKGRFSIAETAAFLTQMARALRGAHDAGIVHRDLKPSNIFLARVDEDEEVLKVLDFGIAKDTSAASVEGETTKTGEIIGSPHYMSPEQVRGLRDLDARSDLWALGVIAFRALTGRLPFPGEVIGAVIGQILADPIPTATSVAPDLPPQVDAFFARVLVRDRAARFANAREMAVAFATLAGAPTPRDRMDSLPDLGPSTPGRASGAPISAPVSSGPPSPVVMGMLGGGTPSPGVLRTPPPPGDGEEATRNYEPTRVSDELKADLLNSAARVVSSSGTLTSSGTSIPAPVGASTPAPAPRAKSKRAVVGLTIVFAGLAGVSLGAVVFLRSGGSRSGSPSSSSAVNAMVATEVPSASQAPPPAAAPEVSATAQPASTASSSAAASSSASPALGSPPAGVSPPAAVPGPLPSAAHSAVVVPVTSASAKKKPPALPGLGF